VPDVRDERIGGDAQEPTGEWDPPVLVAANCRECALERIRGKVFGLLAISRMQEAEDVNSIRVLLIDWRESGRVMLCSRDRFCARFRPHRSSYPSPSSLVSFRRSCFPLLFCIT